MLDMKVGKKPESLYILGYLLELIIKIWQFEFSSSNSGKFGPIFQKKNPLYNLKSYFSG
jgi:hypothetical protein